MTTAILSPATATTHKWWADSRALIGSRCGYIFMPTSSTQLASIAQLAEHLLRKQKVQGSNPCGGRFIFAFFRGCGGGAEPCCTPGVHHHQPGGTRCSITCYMPTVCTLASSDCRCSSHHFARTLTASSSTNPCTLPCTCDTSVASCGGQLRVGKGKPMSTAAYTVLPSAAVGAESTLECLGALIRSGAGKWGWLPLEH